MTYWRLKTLSLNTHFRAGTNIVSTAARDRVGHYLDSLKQHFSGKAPFISHNIGQQKKSEFTLFFVPDPKSFLDIKVKNELFKLFKLDKLTCASWMKGNYEQMMYKTSKQLAFHGLFTQKSHLGNLGNRSGVGQAAIFGTYNSSNFHYLYLARITALTSIIYIWHV